MIAEWRPANIFEALNTQLSCKIGNITLRLDERGWHIYRNDNNTVTPAEEWQNLDVWTACRVLNDLKATQ